MLFHTFKAKIKGTFVISTQSAPPIDTTLIFTKYRIRVSEDRINKLWLDPYQSQVIADKMEYTFDKLLNKNDEKQFSIILKHKLNALDTGIHHLDISRWNRIKCNIIHHRYWLDREKEWFIKTLIAAAIGFVFGIIGSLIGYRQGYENGLKSGKSQTPNTIQK